MNYVEHLPHADGKERSYSAATAWGNLVFPCGQVPVDASGDTPADIFSQTQLCLTNLSNTLLRAGSSIDNILQVTAYLSDIDEFEEYDRAWNSIFASTEKPPRTTLFVQGFRGNKRVELNCIAAITPERNDS